MSDKAESGGFGGSGPEGTTPLSEGQNIPIVSPEDEDLEAGEEEVPEEDYMSPEDASADDTIDDAESAQQDDDHDQAHHEEDADNE